MGEMRGLMVVLADFSRRGGSCHSSAHCCGCWSLLTASSPCALSCSVHGAGEGCDSCGGRRVKAGVGRGLPAGDCRLPHPLP